MTYFEQCNKYFQPLDEIAEALLNQEGIAGLSNFELIALVNANSELRNDLSKYEDCNF